MPYLPTMAEMAILGALHKHVPLCQCHSIKCSVQAVTFACSHSWVAQVLAGSAEAAQLMVQMWQGHGSVLSSAAARLKDEAVSYRLRHEPSQLLPYVTI